MRETERAEVVGRKGAWKGMDGTWEMSEREHASEVSGA